MAEKVKVAIELTKGLAKELLDDDGFVEIVRRANGRYKTFGEARIVDAAERSSEQDLGEVAKKVKKTYDTVKEVHKDLRKVGSNLSELTDTAKGISTNVDGLLKSSKAIQAVSFLGTTASILNLGVDIAGFMVVNEKMDRLTEAVRASMKNPQKLYDMAVSEKLRDWEKLMSDFIYMKGKIRLQDTISFDAMYELLSRIKTFSSEMIRDLMSGAMEEEQVLLIVNQLLSPYLILFREFDRRYYFEKNERPENYEMFLRFFDELVNPELYYRLRDHYFLEERMHDSDVQDILDAQTLIAIDGRTLITDEMAMMEACKKEEVYNELQEQLKKAAEQEIVNEILSEEDGEGVAGAACRRCVAGAFA